MSENQEFQVSKDGLPQMDLAYLVGNGYDAVNELMRAMILRTIEDLNNTGEVYDEAYSYIMNEDDEYIFSFNTICKHLGMDPGKTKYAILNAEHKISTRRRTAAE